MWRRLTKGNQTCESENDACFLRTSQKFGQRKVCHFYVSIQDSHVISSFLFKFWGT